MHKKVLGNHEYLIYILGMILTVFLIIIYKNIVTEFSQIFIVLVYLILLSLPIFHFNRMTRLVKVIFLCILIFFPCMIQGVFSSLLDNVFSKLSVKKDHSSVQLADSDFDFVRKISEEQGILLRTSCSIIEKNQLIHDVKILWSLGKESLLEFSERDNKIRLAISNDALRVINISEPTKCITKNVRNIFKQGSSVVTDDSITNEISKLISEYKDQTDEIIVYGLADLKPYKKRGNKKLSEDRAKEFIRKVGLNNIIMLPYGLANFEYDPYCNKKHLNNQDLDDCNGINRGVILSIKLKKRNNSQ